LKVPNGPVQLMGKIYRDVIPVVHRYLDNWKEKAAQIPNEELRRQALNSINSKAFHCEGGAIYGILAGDELEESVRFVVAYQTISDYLDNLCDRSTSMDPEDFRTLHRSMLHALTPHAPIENYYRCRHDQDDGGYLAELVLTCQDVLKNIPNFERISSVLTELAGYYCELQIHKHVQVEERIPRLQNWFVDHKAELPQMTWYEFSACAGSTLGIFCLVSYGLKDRLDDGLVAKIRKGLFPYVQGLHILLDYFIDQAEDEKSGDLNFCFYYPSKEMLLKRFNHFLKEADKNVKGLPDERFHLLINRGLLGIYLSDAKVKEQRNVAQLAREIINFGGLSSRFFYVNAKLFRKLRGGRAFAQS
jgi:tetraprenyl-beta-curcumene synthase